MKSKWITTRINHDVNSYEREVDDGVLKISWSYGLKGVYVFSLFQENEETARCVHRLGTNYIRLSGEFSNLVEYSDYLVDFTHLREDRKSDLEKIANLLKSKQFLKN